MDPNMDLVTFEDALDRYGVELHRWPGALAAEARSLVESSARARDLLAEAAALHSVLDEVLPVVAAPLGLKTRVFANLPEREAWIEWFTIRIWRPVGLALVPLVVGFGVGVNYADAEHGEDDVLLALFDPDELARYELPSAEGGGEP